MPKKSPFVVLDLLCGAMPVLDGLAHRNVFGPEKKLHLIYHGIDEDKPGYEKHVPERLARLEKHARLGEINFHRERVHFWQPEIFEGQLDRVLNGEKANEIWTVMHNSTQYYKGSSTLEKLAGKLKKGGRLYVIEENHDNPDSILGTALLSLYSPKGRQYGIDYPERVIDENTAREIHATMSQHIQEHAAKFGLELEHYGTRMNENEWYYAPGKPYAQKYQGDLNERIKMHTRFPQYASHYIVLRKK